MISTNNYYKTVTSSNKNNELIIDRLIGWSSTCLDSTIYYYLNYKQNNSLKYKKKKDNKIKF